MARLMVLWRRLVFLARSRRFNAELDDQIQLHLELRAEALMHAGLSREDARREAARAFGNPLHVRESSRAVWGWSRLESLAQDARLAFRAASRHRQLSTVIVVTLGLGIGLSTVVFSLIDAIEWRALPYPGREHLVIVETMAEGTKRLQRVSAAEFEEWRLHAQAFDHLAAWRSETLALGERETTAVAGQLVTCEFFDVLDIAPPVGRRFQPADCQSGAEPVAMLSQGLWRARFDGRRDIVGHRAMIDGRWTRVVGVLPNGFRGFLDGASSRIWLASAAPGGAARDDRTLGIVGRLHRFATAAAAQAQATSLLRRPGDGPAGTSAVVQSLEDMVLRGTSPAARMMATAVGLVLLVACCNVASLLLARNLARRHDIATRVVLGASRWRLVRQLLVETCVLGALAGVAGLALALAALRFLSSAAQPLLAQAGIDAVTVDPRAIVFALAVSLATGLACGLLPALRASDAGLHDRLGERAAGRRVGRARSLLISSQVAVALVLASAALLLVRSFIGCVEATRAPGFRTENVLTFVVSAGGSGPGGTQPARIAQLLERVEQLPGVAHAAVVSRLPLAENPPRVTVGLPGKASGTAAYRVVSPGYFAAIALALRAGRLLTSSDDGVHPKVAVANEALARRLAGRGSAIGLEVEVAGSRRTIVGVVADAGAVRAGEPVAPEVLVPFAQQSEQPARLLVSAVSGDAIVAALRQVCQEWAPQRPSPEIQPLAVALAGPLRGLGMVVGLAGGFGAIAIGLTLVGICGLVSYSVARRTREIGVRMALGASGRAVVRLVVGQALARTVVGVAIGMSGALAVSRVLPSRLFGVQPASPLLLVAIATAFLCTALIAALLPARRALHVDPTAALRVE